LKKLIIIFSFFLLLYGCSHIACDVPVSLPADPVVLPDPTMETTVPTTFPSAPTSASTVPKPEFDPYTIIKNMSVEELTGQIFLARCPDNTAVPDILTYQFGGYLLFGKDFSSSTADAVRARLEGFQEASNLPMLIAVDEEGGTVTRVSSYTQFRSTPFPSPRSLYSQGGLDAVIEAEQEKCQLLKGLGINVILSPVCDITTDPDAFMYKRSLGQSPAITGAFAAEACKVMACEQVGSVLKHFPGYGNNRDTHTGIAVDSRPLEDLEEYDLIPFRAGISAGCGGILVSHIVTKSIDSNLPASLSPKVITYLRERLGFTGVIITDDLIMEAITDVYGSGEAAVLAVLAGNDMLCSSDYAIQYTAVLDAVKSGRIPLNQLQESVARILLWKFKIGLLN